MPAGLVERARAFLAGQVAPAPTRDAATVALVRDGATGVEVLLLRRVATMAFAAGMHVFPGGRVDPADADPRTAWSGPEPGWFAAQLGCAAPTARSLVCAAVRETFEECGVLLADPVPTASGSAEAGWEADRAALLARQATLAELLARRGLAVGAGLLHPLAHWITPEFEPRRYDTRFFLARLPEGQRARHVGGEAAETTWVRPSEALAQHATGQMPMLPPTVDVLTRLAGAPDVSAAFALREEIVPLLPRPVLTSDGRLLLDVAPETRPPEAGNE